MPAQTLFIVQQFDKVGRRIVAGRQLPFKTAAEAIGRAERDAARCVGVVAIQQTVDIETGEVLEEPVVLVARRELPQEFRRIEVRLLATILTALTRMEPQDFRIDFALKMRHGILCGPFFSPASRRRFPQMHIEATRLRCT